MSSAVVFDLFHTLINPEAHTPPGYSYRRNLIELLGANPQDFMRFWDAGYRERETTPIDLVDMVERYQVGVGGPALTDHQRRQADHWFGIGKDESLRNPDPTVVDLVRRVGERRPVGVLSNCHGRETRAWPASPLAAPVSVFVRSCDIGAMKPEIETYRAILAELGADAASSIYVGNGGGDELAGASRAGFGTVIHMNGFDAVNGVIEPAEQVRRRAQADLGAASSAELAEALFALL